MRRVWILAPALWAAACAASPAVRLGSPLSASTLRAGAVAALRDVLSSGPAEAKVAAIRVAERFDVGALFDPVSRLLDAGDERVRAAAAGATLRAHPDAPGVLREALTATRPEARALAIAILARRVGEPAAADLLPALADPDPLVREAAVAAVAAWIEPATLAAMATGDASGGVRARALEALGRRRAAAGLAAARTALADGYLGARLAAADALFAIAGRESAADLGAATDPFVELRAAVLLGDRAAGVRAAAASGDPALRAAAAVAATGDLEVVRELARDPQPAVRLAAARALLRAGAGAEARELLARGLGLPDPWLRLGAAADLAAEGDDRGARALLALAADPDAAVRVAVLRALPRRGKIPDLAGAALRDPSADVRVAAAEVILERLE